jgi:hypothetical protein
MFLGKNNVFNLTFTFNGKCTLVEIAVEKPNGRREKDSWSYVEKGNPSSRKFGGRQEGKQSSEVLPGEIVERYELVAFLGIQFLMGYHRLLELSMYWERQPDSGYGLIIIHQAMTRERFKKHMLTDLRHTFVFIFSK